MTAFQNTYKSMTKTKKRRPKKRGPKEERLIISEDPQTALAKLLKPIPPKPGK